MEKFQINGKFISFVRGDITEQETEAIVNAANSCLILGAGVAGAIRSKGGPAIQEACDAIGGTQVGTAVITCAGNLPAKYVIHAVGPVMGEGNEDTKLAGATRCALQIAAENKLKSITFPAISSGIFGFPLERCAAIMIRGSIDFLQTAPSLQEIRFCLWDEKAYTTFVAFCQSCLQNK